MQDYIAKASLPPWSVYLVGLSVSLKFDLIRFHVCVPLAWVGTWDAAKRLALAPLIRYDDFFVLTEGQPNSQTTGLWFFFFFFFGGRGVTNYSYKTKEKKSRLLWVYLEHVLVTERIVINTVNSSFISPDKRMMAQLDLQNTTGVYDNTVPVRLAYDWVYLFLSEILAESYVWSCTYLRIDLNTAESGHNLRTSGVTSTSSSVSRLSYHRINQVQ